MERFRLEEAKQEPTATSRPSNEPTSKTEMRKLLVILAEARQAEVSSETLRVYSKALDSHDAQDVAAAVAILGTRERRDGETAFPALATILSVCRSEKVRRIERKTQEAREKESKYIQEHPEEFATMKEIVEAVGHRAKRRAAGEDLPIAPRPEWTTDDTERYLERQKRRA